jgi:hypothetical protein
MSRSPFGWDLPPGVTSRMIDEAAGIYDQCEVCGLEVGDCICPECPECGEVGNPDCYENHGLVRTPEQQQSHAATREHEKNEDAAYDDMIQRQIDDEERK